MIARTLLRTIAIAVTIAGAAAAPVAAQKTLSDMLSVEQASLLARSSLPGDDAVTAFKLGRDLALLYVEHEEHLRTAARAEFIPSNRLLRLSDDHVVIDFFAETDAEALREELRAISLVDATVYRSVVSGRLPVSAIAGLTALGQLRFARPAYAATGVGSVTSQGDTAMGSSSVRVEFSIDGTGVTVGTLSDSFDCLGGAATDVGSGDLPAGVVVLTDITPPCIDEGRAMMQIVADVAPGATLGFHTGFLGQADFALGIEELAGCPPGSSAGCTPAVGFAADVINDDIFYFAEPFFQDGIIAQAVDGIVAQGVAYFTLAGNHARKSYESAFEPSGVPGPFGSELHDFDPGAGVDTMQSITVPAGASVTFSFQWDGPYFSVSGPPGAANDHDIFIYDAAGTTILEQGVDFNEGGDPTEVFTFDNPGPATSFNIAISNFSGPNASVLKYIALVNGALGNLTVNEFDTASSTIYGHMNSADAVTVGAAPYFDTPNFGTFPALPEPFTSAGPTPVLYDVGGSPISEVRAKPDLVAPDKGNNTFFGSDIPEDGDTLPNFSGTSAATPHAAGAGALLLETSNLTPSGVQQIMQAGAALFDMDPPGFDDDTGFGFFQANYAAYDATVAPGSWTGLCDLPSFTLTGVPNDGPQSFRAGSSITWGAGTFNDLEGIAPEHIFTDGFESGDTAAWSNSGCP